ncbi:hypothetical protein V6N13_031386 [Hibiscus sabdariffa]
MGWNMFLPIVEVTGHKAHGPVPESGSVVLVRVTKVMARTVSVDIMCIGPKSIREKFTGIISCLLEMHGLTTYQRLRMNWALCLPRAQLQLNFSFVVYCRCNNGSDKLDGDAVPKSSKGRWRRS